MKWIKKYLEIARKIQEIVSVIKIEIYFLCQVLDSILVWNISDHNCCTRIITNDWDSYLKYVWIENVAERSRLHFLCLIVHRMILYWCLIVHCTGVTFLYRLIDWKNTPNLIGLITAFRSVALLWRMFLLLPFTLDSFRFNLVQNTVQRLSNNIWRLFKSFLAFWFLYPLLFLVGLHCFFLLWRLSHFDTLRSFG